MLQTSLTCVATVRVTRHFSKATGMSLVEWLINERLQRTRELLESTTLPVESIADLVGFRTPTALRQHKPSQSQRMAQDFWGGQWMCRWAAYRHRAGQTTV